MEKQKQKQPQTKQTNQTKKAQSHHRRQNDNKKLHLVILGKIPDADVAITTEEPLLSGLIVQLHRNYTENQQKNAFKWHTLYPPQEVHSSATDEPLERTCTTGKHFFGTEIMKSVYSVPLNSNFRYYVSKSTFLLMRQWLHWLTLLSENYNPESRLSSNGSYKPKT